MFFATEFELYKGEEYILAEPFGMLGCTEGYDFNNALFMAADWLKCELEARLMGYGEEPKPSFGNKPQHENGQVVVIGVEVSLEAVDTVTASEAAELLGVSRPRITQMLNVGKLMGYTKGHATFVTRESVDARLAEKPKAGRPRKAAAK